MWVRGSIPGGIGRGRRGPYDDARAGGGRHRAIARFGCVRADPPGRLVADLRRRVWRMFLASDRGVDGHLEGLGGAVAQLGERLTGSQEVDGSIPFSSTILSSPPAECAEF